MTIDSPSRSRIGVSTCATRPLTTLGFPSGTTTRVSRPSSKSDWTDRKYGNRLPLCGLSLRKTSKRFMASECSQAVAPDAVAFDVAVVRLDRLAIVDQPLFGAPLS